MAPFSPDEALQNRMDWLMFQLGPVHVVRSSVFEPTLTWYSTRGYETIVLDGARWRTRAQFAADLTSSLDMPQDWDGQRYDALDDCLSDVAWGEGAMTKSALGLCVGFRNFEAFESQLGEGGLRILLDICSSTSATAALFGNRWMWIFERNTEVSDRDRGGRRAWFHDSEPPGLRVVGY